MIDVFYFDGKVKKGEVKDLAELKNKRLWIDATNIKRKEADLLRKIFKFHPVTEEDMFLSHGRIKVEQFPNYLFCTFYSVIKERHKINLIPLDYIIGENFVISTHKVKLGTYEALKKEEELLKDLFKRGVDVVFYRLLDGEIDNFFPVLEELDDEIEKLDEELAYKAHPKLLSKILRTKRKIAEIKKITFPQREKISFLARRRYRFLSEHSQPYFRDLFDHSISVSDVIENYRETLGSTFDAYMTSVSNNMNEIMKVLTIIATIAIPLTVISGIYGTNFINLPGSKVADGFWLMLIIMGMMMVGMIMFFRKRKWF